MIKVLFQTLVFSVVTQELQLKTKKKTAVARNHEKKPNVKQITVTNKEIRNQNLNNATLNTYNYSNKNNNKKIIRTKTNNKSFRIPIIIQNYSPKQYDFHREIITHQSILRLSSY